MHLGFLAKRSVCLLTNGVTYDETTIYSTWRLLWSYVMGGIYSQSMIYSYNYGFVREYGIDSPMLMDRDIDDVSHIPTVMYDSTVHRVIFDMGTFMLYVTYSGNYSFAARSDI